jgi:hypothetical protein
VLPVTARIGWACFTFTCSLANQSQLTHSLPSSAYHCTSSHTASSTCHLSTTFAPPANTLQHAAYMHVTHTMTHNAVQVHTRTHTHTHTHTHTTSRLSHHSLDQRAKGGLREGWGLHTHAHMHTHTHTQANTHTHAPLTAHSGHARTHAHTHTHTHTHVHSVWCLCNEALAILKLSICS